MNRFNKYIGVCLLALVAGSTINAKGGCNKADGSAYTPTTLAISCHGAVGGRDDGGNDGCAAAAGFDNWVVANNGDEWIARLKTACSASGTITKLNSHSHGDVGWGLVMTKNSGFYYSYHSEATAAAATIADLQQKINNNEVRFCNPVIKLHACSIGSSNFGQMLSAVTQGTVYVASGTCFRDGTTGWFWSSGSSWKKYVNGVEISNPHLTDPDLTTPNQYGTNKCRFW